MVTEHDTATGPSVVRKLEQLKALSCNTLSSKYKVTDIEPVK